MYDDTKFHIDQAVALEEGLKGVNDHNHCVVTLSNFRTTHLPHLHQLVTNDQYDTTAWVRLTGNMFAKLVVIADDHSKVIYEIPSILDQGYTASPDPEDISLNDKLDHTSNMRDVLSSIAIQDKHRVYMEHHDTTLEKTYTDDAIKAATTIALLNTIFKEHGYETITMPEGLDEYLNIVKESKVDKPTKTPEVEEDVDYDDGEML